MNRMNIYVGNLPFDATKDQIEALFAPFGQVESVRIINDKVTGSPRGFAFVQMSDGGQASIDALNNKDFLGKQLRVNEARPREEGGAPRRNSSYGNNSNSSYNNNNRRSRY